MRAAPDIIRRMLRAGIRLSARGDRLLIEAPRGALTPDVRALLANRKADLLAALTGTRARLATLADANRIDGRVVDRLDDVDLRGLETEHDDTLRAYLHALADSAERDAGRCPPGYTMPALCDGCGPVWLWPDIAKQSVRRATIGWPIVAACPWCFRKKAHKPIPRPTVTCATCANYRADPINPSAGMGSCGIAIDADPRAWPMAARQCAAFRQ